MAESFLLEEEIHHAGDARCPACLTDYPEPCPCGGLIHAAGDVDDDEGAVISTTRCDACGRSQDDLEEEVA